MEEEQVGERGKILEMKERKCGEEERKHKDREEEEEEEEEKGTSEL